MCRYIDACGVVRTSFSTISTISTPCIFHTFISSVSLFSCHPRSVYPLWCHFANGSNRPLLALLQISHATWKNKDLFSVGWMMCRSYFHLHPITLFLRNLHWANHVRLSLRCQMISTHTIDYHKSTHHITILHPSSVNICFMRCVQHHPRLSLYPILHTHPLSHAHFFWLHVSLPQRCVHLYGFGSFDCYFMWRLESNKPISQPPKAWLTWPIAVRHFPPVRPSRHLWHSPEPLLASGGNL